MMPPEISPESCGIHSLCAQCIDEMNSRENKRARVSAGWRMTARKLPCRLTASHGGIMG